MRVAVVGTRGIPGVHGGVERHCEELYPVLAALGVDVTVYAREGYADNDQDYRGVRVCSLRAPNGKGIEAFAHTAAAMRRAAKDGCDVLHVHSIGPGALIPYARLLGHRCIVATLHAPDYRQQKWGALSSAYLKMGEQFAAHKSDAAISVSKWYADELAARYGRRPTVIPNGPGLTGYAPSENPPILESLGLSGSRFLLFVGRLIPDKCVEELLEAAERLDPPIRVVVAGDSSDSDAYAAGLRVRWSDIALFVGYVYGQELTDLYAAASVVVLPSRVEGLPICLLEAMRFDTPIVASDIPANREVLDGGRAGMLYPSGDVDALREALTVALRPSLYASTLDVAKARVASEYAWDSIASRTFDVYREALGVRGTYA